MPKAEALRERRARQIKVQAEVEAAALLRQAAGTVMQSPANWMCMITEVGAEQDTLTIMMPGDFVDMARWIQRAEGEGAASNFSSCPPKGQTSMAASNAPNRWRYEFYACYDLPHRIEKLQACVDAFADHFNTQRPHDALAGLTPAEYLKSRSFPQSLIWSEPGQMPVRALIWTKLAAARSVACRRAKATKVAQKRRHGAVAALFWPSPWAGSSPDV